MLSNITLSRLSSYLEGILGIIGVGFGVTSDFIYSSYPGEEMGSQ
jgi:hypothetical protein